jgi:putative DNA primase/helicase
VSTGQILDFNNARPQGDAPQAISADSIRSEITARAREFVEWMFPCSVVHKSGRYAVIGDVYGQPGESLHIQLSGTKAGQWHDWASSSDRGGDLIGLFMATNNLHSQDFPKALETINNEFLGRTTPEWTRKFTIQFKERAKEHADKPRPQINDRPPPTESYIYKDAHGGIIGVVKRHEYEDVIDPTTGKPKKTFTVWDAKLSKAQAPMPRPLYRIPEISKVNDVVFVEGEKKADSLAAAGIEATCIMFGSNAPLDKVDWTPITGKNIKIWPDKDESGIGFAENLAPILSALGCSVSVVTPPANKPKKWDAADCIAEGGDPIAILQSAGAAKPRPDVFKLYTLEELEHLPAPKWLISDVIVENSICLFWAGSDSYKTFVAIDIAFCISTGSSWQGRPVVPGPVVYVAAEDITGVTSRMIGWRETKGRELPRADITLLNDNFTLASPDADKLIRSIELLAEKPKLIVIDTLARSFGAGNEDKTSDMNAFVQACDKLRRATKATIMIVHHTGRNPEQERGNVSLRAACDTIFTIQKGKAGKITLINSPPKGKQKNAEPFKDIALRTQKVHFERGGVEQSTLVIMSDDDGAPSAGEPIEDDETQDPGPQLGQVEKSILTALDKAARGGRSTLGFTSLHAMVGGDSGSVGRALRKLEEKELISVTTDESDPNPKKKRKIYALIK